ERRLVAHSVAFGAKRTLTEPRLQKADLRVHAFRPRNRWPGARRAEAQLFIAMRATGPLQDLLYFVRDPWPWGKPHEAAGIHRASRTRRVAARVARAAGHDACDWICISRCA